MSDWFGDFLKYQENNVETDGLSTLSFTKNEPESIKNQKNPPITTIQKNQEKEKNLSKHENKEILELIKNLKDLRSREAHLKNLPLYCIFANSVIDDISNFLPTNKDDLIKIKGLGKKKIEQYGDEIIELVNNFIKNNPQHKSKEIPTTIKNKKSQKIDLPKIEKKEEIEINFIEDETTLKIKELIKNGENIFITGSAGTGKSFLLNRLKKEFNIEVTSTTGLAAVNIGGQTIHAWTGVGICNLPIDYAIKSIIKKSHLTKKIRNTKILAIDEISMLDAQTFDYINNVLKAIRSNNKPFGGIQLILFGDFFQLPPVEKNGGFCFEATAWKELNIKNILLKKIYRQDDAAFAQILNDIRQNKLNQNDLNTFYQRNNHPLPPNKDILHIFSTNEAADNYNLQKFNALQTQAHELISKDILMKNEEADKLITTIEEIEKLSIAKKKTWDILDKYCKVTQVITLKKGCRVMLLKNIDFEAGLINGSCGEVENIGDEGITVKFDNGELRIIKQEEFDYSKDGKLLARRIQYPLRLAYGITIHKSQGMTLDEVFIDFNRIFEYGQAYVALSRAKSIDGLYLKGFNPQKIMANPKIIDFYKKLEQQL